MKKVAREWEQKYYKEKAISIKILQADTMRVAKVSLSTKPVLASKVETIVGSGSKGKEVIREAMQTSEYERSNLTETNEELSIQFGLDYFLAFTTTEFCIISWITSLSLLLLPIVVSAFEANVGLVDEDTSATFIVSAWRILIDLDRKSVV